MNRLFVSQKPHTRVIQVKVNKAELAKIKGELAIMRYKLARQQSYKWVGQDSKKKVFPLPIKEERIP